MYKNGAGRKEYLLEKHYSVMQRASYKQFCKQPKVSPQKPQKPLPARKKKVRSPEEKRALLDQIARVKALIAAKRRKP